MTSSRKRNNFWRYTVASAMLWYAMSCFIACGTALAEGDDVLRELWTGRAYTSTFRIGVCVRDNGDLRGAMLLRRMGGEVDVYHIYGRMSEGRFTARHNSGHIFEGPLEDDNTVKFTVTLSNGRVLHLEGKRMREPNPRSHLRPNLREDTCRPLE